MKVVSRGEEETREIGRRLAQGLAVPSILLLIGDLGAGKTALTRGFLEGLDAEDSRQVHSPTFTLVNEYRSRRGKVFHIDLYRLDTLRDFQSIGLDELLDSGCWVLIEWADKLGHPVEGSIRIELVWMDDETREIRFSGLPEGTGWTHGQIPAEGPKEAAPHRFPFTQGRG